MAKNGPKGGGRIGAVRGRSQTYNPTTKHWVKREGSSGQFMDGKTDSKPFKGVRREK